MTIKSFLSTVIALVAVSVAAWSQTPQDGSAIKSNHSISLTTLGAEYGYEQRLGGNWTLIGRVGLVPAGLDLSSHLNSFNANFNMAYGITVEPRYYTSFSRRLAAGKPTVNNSSDFIAIRAQGLSDGDNIAVSLTPMYGIRRHGGKHWYHEFTFGACITDSGNNFDITPHVQYRLGFIF